MRASRLISSAGLLMIGIGLGMAFVSPRTVPDHAVDVVLPPPLTRTPAVTMVPDRPEADTVVTSQAPTDAHGGEATGNMPKEPGRDGLFSPAGAAVSASGSLLDGSAKPAAGRISEAAVTEATPADAAEAEPARPLSNVTRARARLKSVKRDTPPAGRQASHSFEHPLGVR
ncbi:MAG: hypothetical protein JNM89_01590 [Hyphomicrobiaceae bacterium]|nr:hypothetical protein [Hyphomicrobiaceae bacterium]